MKATISAFLIAAVCAAAWGCGGSSSPTPITPTPQPQPATLDLTGVWSGPASDSSGPGTMSWNLAKTSTGASGQATTRTPQGTVVLTGTVTVELSGTSGSWTMSIPAGGVSVAPECTVTVTGALSVSPASAPTSMTGTYSGTGSCAAAFSNGTITLTKQ